MGSSDYSLQILKNLIPKFSINLVVTQPDKPTGRGKRIEPALIKVFADESQIPVIQPEKIKEDVFRDAINSYSIDLIIVAAYGKILPKWLLEATKYASLNVHGSLLPRWRGASPIQAAILNGDLQTGATIMIMDEGIDTGPIISSMAVKIDPDETAKSLSKKIAAAGSELLNATLPDYLKGKLKPQAQSESDATYSGLIKKEDGLLDLDQPAEILERKIRAYNPWPVCFFDWNSTRFRVYKAEVSNEKKLGKNQRGTHKNYPAIGTSTNDLILLEIQPSGKNKIDGKAFLNGARNWLN
jgi:methionyl-tRNA formyltransferase